MYQLLAQPIIHQLPQPITPPTAPADYRELLSNPNSSITILLPIDDMSGFVPSLTLRANQFGELPSSFQRELVEFHIFPNETIEMFQPDTTLPESLLASRNTSEC